VIDLRNDTFLTVAEVAAMLRLNPQTIRNWIDAGELPAVRVGERRVRILRRELDAFLQHSTHRWRGWRATEGAQAGDELLTVGEMAGMLGVNTRTVRSRIDSGQLSAVRVGERGVRIRRRDLHPGSQSGPSVPLPAFERASVLGRGRTSGASLSVVIRAAMSVLARTPAVQGSHPSSRLGSSPACCSSSIVGSPSRPRWVSGSCALARR